MNEKILVAEDEPSILTGIVDLLESEGYNVLQAVDGEIALQHFRQLKPDLIILDIMMPKMSGYDVCRSIRREDPYSPILMLTAKGEEIDKVVGLELGADDYIVKPFGIAELLARIRSALRRGALRNSLEKQQNQPLSATFGNVVFDFNSMTGTKNALPLNLTPRESALLRYFVLNEGKVISREELLEYVWGIEYDITTRSVDQHVARLRQKLEDDPAHPRFFLTVHGIGYRYEGGNEKT